MYTGFLRTIYSFSLLGIFILLAAVAYMHHEKMDGEHKDGRMGMMENHMDKNSSEKGSDTAALEEKVAMLETALQQMSGATQETMQGVHNISFFLEKTVDANFSAEEKEALITEYKTLLEEQQAAFEAQQAEAANAPVVPAAE